MQQEIQRRKGVPGLDEFTPHTCLRRRRRAVERRRRTCRSSRDSKKTRVLVTGADGFVGRHLVPYLVAQGYSVIAASRAATTFDNPDVTAVPLSDLSRLFDWQPLLDQCDAVVHLAGIAHKYAGDDFYDRVNHRATSALARAISRGATKHLVFISSIAAQSGSYADHDLTEDDFPTPNNAYGRSKFAAEQAIRAAGISFTILRPVVIYGEGEKGNFATVHRLSRLPIPLPFGALYCAAIRAVDPEFQLGRRDRAEQSPRAGRNLHRVRPGTGHGRRSHRASPRQPRQTTLADAGARKLDQGCRSRPPARVRFGSGSANLWWLHRKAACDRLGAVLNDRLRRSRRAQNRRCPSDVKHAAGAWRQVNPSSLQGHVRPKFAAPWEALHDLPPCRI